MQYFTIKELTRSNKAFELGIDNHPSLPVVGNLEFLIDTLLDPVRGMWGKPLHVSSGYRCEELNKAVGGSKTSAHLKGLAADIYTGLGIDIYTGLGVEKNKELFEMIREHRDELRFDQCIIEYGGSVIHLGTRRDGRLRKEFLTTNDCVHFTKLQ